MSQEQHKEVAMPLLTRRTLTQSLLAAPVVLTASRAVAQTQAATTPAADWAFAELAGYTPAGFEAVEARLVTLPTTALMVVTGGRVVYRYGDVAQVSYLASARKSVLSMLYGKYVANGTIDLDRTMGELGIDEDDALLPIEKTARIRDLLIASSGVYHKAGSPGDDPATPARGSQPPGTHFHYNNWDFNVLGAVFEKLTGRSVFAALEQDLARPLGFQDFDPARQRMMGYQNQSRYLAYHLFLSARDMARLGLVMARGGQWNGAQLIPADWVRESTKERVPARATGRNGELGYAYLWWIPDTRTAPQWAGSFMASGQFGQYILVLPTIDTVAVHRRAVTDEFAIARNLGKTDFKPLPATSGDFLKIADLIVAAKTG
jgi:CubicO group peptidase (beta-lactamase class C family)